MTEHDEHDTSLVELRAALAAMTSTPERDRERLLASFDGLVAAMVRATMINRRLLAHEQNRRLASARLDEALGTTAIEAITRTLGTPMDAGVTLDEARASADALARELSSSADLTSVLIAAARVVRALVV
jgi:hypothetical protein